MSEPMNHTRKIFLITAGIGILLLVGVGSAMNVSEQITRLVFPHTLAELDKLDGIHKTQLLPVMTFDELPADQKDAMAETSRTLERYRGAKCMPERIYRFDKRLVVSPAARPVHELPPDLAVASRNDLGQGCTNYQLVAFSRRPFLLSAHFNNGTNWVEWARSNKDATQLWEAHLIKNFLADFTGFASLSRDALGLDQIASRIIENFLEDLFKAGPDFHYQHEMGRHGWVISLPKAKADATLKSLLLFARQSLQNIYTMPGGAGKIYEWSVLNRKILITETKQDLIISTGLGTLVSYLSVDAKLWQSQLKGDGVLTIRLDALLGSLVSILQSKSQATLSQLQTEFTFQANAQGLKLQRGAVSPSKIPELLGESLVPELYDALPQEFTLAAGLSWTIPSLEILRDAGLEVFLKKSNAPDSGLLMIWDIDPKNNSQVALVGFGNNPQPAQVFAKHVDLRGCETRAHKKLWIVASHPDLGTRIQASCRTATSPYRKVLQAQKPNQKSPQAMLAIHPGELIKSLYMLGGGHPSATESNPASGKEAGLLQAKAEAMRQVKDFTANMPLVGYAGRAYADGSIQWQGF